jgi:hypothetical protein
MKNEHLTIGGLAVQIA